MNIRIAGIEKESVVDGPGLRFVVFTQGCPHECPGCHNPQTHDPAGGKLIAVQEVFKMIKQAKLIRGVTFSGGEPFMQAQAVAYLAEQTKSLGLNTMTYTGFVFEQLLVMSAKKKYIRELLQNTDILVDGPFIEAQKDLRLVFRGSANQRLLDVPQSLKAGRVVEWENQERKIWA